MASLSKFRRDVAAIRGGEWVEVGIFDNVFRILTRGATQEFRDGLSRLRRDAAAELNRHLRPGQDRYTELTLPPTMDDALHGRAIADHCILDVADLNHTDAVLDGAGKVVEPAVPVTADEFRAMMRNHEEYGMVISLAYAAIGRVGDKTVAEREAAVGNSPKPSASTYSTATSDSV